jgi:hypothetical protein
MNSLQVIEFEFVPLFGDAVQMVPMIDLHALTDLAEAFETRMGHEPVGGYAGLVLEHYNFGDLNQYLTGERLPWPGRGVPLLGCECGEWGCWPLVAEVTIADSIVQWSAFRQPHRPSRSYQGFGPFRFAEEQYRVAVSTAAQSRLRD